MAALPPGSSKVLNRLFFRGSGASNEALASVRDGYGLIDQGLSDHSDGTWATQESEEASTFREPEGQWAPAGGRKAERVTTEEKYMKLMIAASAATGLYKGLPSVYKILQPDFASVLPEINSTNNLDFFYKFSRRVENTSVGGNYLSSVFNIFAKAANVSPTLSVFADRGDLKVSFSISNSAIGKEASYSTREWLAREFEISRTRLAAIDEVVFENRTLTVGEKYVDTDGKIKIRSTGEILSTDVDLMDKGRGSLGYATSHHSYWGERLPDRSIRGTKIFGEYGYIPVKGSVARQADRVVSSYAATALQRTSFLIDEIVGEGRRAIEFFSSYRSGKTGANQNKRLLTELSPRLTLSNASHMVFKYTGTAMKAGAALMAVNQIGFSKQQGGFLSSTVGGVAQTALLSYAGGKAASLFGKSVKGGRIAGGIAGGLGMLGIGPFQDGPVPGIAGIIGSLNVIRSQIGELTPVNKLRRGFERVMPGSTGLTASIGAGLVLGSAFTAYSRMINKENLVNPAARRDYLRSMDWNSLDDLRTPQVRQNLSPGELARFNKIDPIVRAKIQAEINDLIGSYEDRKSFGTIQNLYGKPEDTGEIRAKALERQLTVRDYKALVDDTLTTKKPALAKVQHFAARASLPRAMGYMSAVGAVAWAALSGSFGTLERPGEVRRLNRGEQLEEVKKGRFWEFGNSPYEGTETQYFGESWIAKLRSGASQAGATGDRGQLEEFFLKNFSYKLEKDNYWTRPAPITSGAFDQTPFIYPLIKPFADLIKRPKLMHVDEWARVNGSQIEYLEATGGLDDLPDLSLGGISMAAPESPYTVGAAIGKSLNEIAGLQGLLGFYQKSGFKMLTGAGFSNDKPKLESFSENMSPVNKFQDYNFGGGVFGIPFVSEPIRRFLVKPEYSENNYNVIVNKGMPSWMPSALKVGNAFTSLPGGSGASRLPGEGYAQRFQELKGVSPEQYPAMHRFNILADVAPWSAEYQEVKGQVQDMVERGMYSEDAEVAYYRRARQAEIQRDKRSASPRSFDPDQYITLNGKIESVDYRDMTFKIEGVSSRFTMAGVSNDMEALITDKNLSIRQAAEEKARNAEKYRSMVKPGMSVRVTTSRTPDGAVDSSGRVKALVEHRDRNLNLALSKKGRFGTDESAIGQYAMVSGFERPLSKLWEEGSHKLGQLTAPAEYLGMFGFSPFMKTMAHRDALEEYEQTHVYGREMRDWQSPLKDWFMPAVHTAAHNLTGLDFVPDYLVENRRIDEKFDKLKYQKYNMLIDEAKKMGRDDLVASYKKARETTVMGGTGFVNERKFRRIMGDNEEKFALSMARESNIEKRQQILAALPEHKRRLMAGQYMNRDLEALERAASAGGLGTEGLDQMYKLQQMKRDRGYVRDEESLSIYRQSSRYDETFGEFSQRLEADAFFNKDPAPRPDWIGFNPAVDMQDVKLKYIEAEGKSFHDFSIYPSRQRILHRKPYIDNIDVQMTGISTQSLFHARSAVHEVQRMMGSPYTDALYNINSPSRITNTVSLDVVQNRDYIPGEF